MAGELTKISDYLSFASKTITNKIVEFLTSKGINVTSRWISLLILFLSLLMIFIGIKVGKPIVKIILFVIGGLLLMGLLFPNW